MSLFKPTAPRPGPARPGRVAVTARDRSGVGPAARRRTARSGLAAAPPATTTRGRRRHHAPAVARVAALGAVRRRLWRRARLRRRPRRRRLVGGEALALEGVGALTLVDLDEEVRPEHERQLHALRDSVAGRRTCSPSASPRSAHVRSARGRRLCHRRQRGRARRRRRRRRLGRRACPRSAAEKAAIVAAAARRCARRHGRWRGKRDASRVRATDRGAGRPDDAANAHSGCGSARLAGSDARRSGVPRAEPRASSRRRRRRPAPATVAAVAGGACVRRGLRHARARDGRLRPVRGRRHRSARRGRAAARCVRRARRRRWRRHPDGVAAAGAADDAGNDAARRAGVRRGRRRLLLGSHHLLDHRRRDAPGTVELALMATHEAEWPPCARRGARRPGGVVAPASACPWSRRRRRRRGRAWLARLRAALVAKPRSSARSVSTASREAPPRGAVRAVAPPAVGREAGAFISAAPRPAANGRRCSRAARARRRAAPPHVSALRARGGARSRPRCAARAPARSTRTAARPPRLRAAARPRPRAAARARHSAVLRLLVGRERRERPRARARGDPRVADDRVLLGPSPRTRRSTTAPRGARARAEGGADAQVRRDHDGDARAAAAEMTRP